MVTMAIIVLLLAGWAAWLLFGRVRVVEVTNLAQIEAEQAVTIAAPAAGQITAIHTELGQEVAAGDLLFELDDGRQQTPIQALQSGLIGEIADLRPGVFVRQGDRLGVIIAPGGFKIVAHFQPADALGRIQAGQPARLRLDGYPWTQFGTLPASVTNVAAEARFGLVRVDLALEPGANPAITLQHGLPGTLEIEVEHLSPAALLLRVAGQ